MPEGAAGAPAPRRARDPRLDALRGLALVMIFVNHVPGNAFEGLTSRAFGFSDAAEGFVLMAGIAAGLAYGPAFRGPGVPWRGIGRVWRRAWTIYLVHLLVVIAALALAAGMALLWDDPQFLGRNKMEVAFGRPVEALLALPLLLYQPSYGDILPLYVALLLAAPGVLWLAWRTPRTLLAGSVALWLLVGEMRWNLPQWPVAYEGWQFAPLSWQVVFVVGALAGVAAVAGRRLVPVRADLLALAGGVLILALAWKVVPGVGAAGNGALSSLREAGAPWMLTGFHKVWETAPRLLHALALAYVLSALPAVARASASRAAAPLRLLGRQSLPVFALGSVLAYAAQGVRVRTGVDPLLDAGLIGGGILLQLGLALARERWPG